MNFSEMPWQAALVWTMGCCLIACGVIAVIAGLWHDEKQRKRDLRRFDARVGRDAWRDIRGTHR